MANRPVIDHDPNEPKDRPMGVWFWLYGWAIVAVGWLLYLSTRSPDWLSIGLGAITGGVFMCWSFGVFDRR